MSAILLFAACSGAEKKVEKPVKEEAKKAEEQVKKEAKKEMQKQAETVKEEPKPTVIHWSYSGAFGPQFWGNLDESFQLCKMGKRQSPINLVWSKPKKEGSNLSLSYKETKLHVVDTGHAMEFLVDPGSMMKHNGMDYELKSIRYHVPSEHQLSGNRFAAEMQLNHTSSDGRTSVMSVFFKEGKENPMFEKLFEKMPTEKNKPLMDPAFIYTASVLVPNKLHHYNYEGSLTQPPCTEAVNWLVLNTPVELSKAQIARLRSFYSANNRPIQPTNDREYSNY